MEKMDALQRSWQEQADRRRTAAAESLRTALADHGEVARIVLEYDGAGDEGMVESLDFYDASDAIVEVGDQRLRDAAEEFAVSHLPGGWETELGSHGTVTIDVRGERLQVEHSDRTVAYDDSRWTVLW